MKNFTFSEKLIALTAVLMLLFGLPSMAAASGTAMTGTTPAGGIHTTTPGATPTAMTGTTPQGGIAGAPSTGTAMSGTTKPISIPGTGASVTMTGTRSSGIMAVVNLFQLSWK